jgi:putative peptidoglycan lipid II flippase
MKLSHVSRSSIILAVFFALNTSLALVRQVIIARQFGLSIELDAYNAANNIPDLLFSLISGGALAFALIPVLSEYIEKKGRKDTWKLFSHVLNITFVVTGILCVIVAIFAKELVAWEFGIAPGFTPEQQELVAHLMRINLIATLIFSMSGIIMSGLQAHQHFILTAVAPPLYNIGQIFGALVLAPTVPYTIMGVSLPAFGFGIEGLVYGVLVGALFHVLVQIPALIYYQFRWSIGLNFRHAGVQRILQLMAPRLVTVFLIQLIFLSRDNLASRLDEGAITALAYGWTIMQVPETLIGTAIGTALLPTLSEHASAKRDAAFTETVNKATRVILAFGMFITIVSSIVLYPLIDPIFGFSEEGTTLLVWTARAYLLGLLGHSLLEVVARSFYAEQDANTPLIGTVIRVGLFIVIAIILFRPLNVVGIALADTIGVTVEVIFMYYLLRKRLPNLLRFREGLVRIGVGILLSVGLLFVLLVVLPFPDFITAFLAAAASGICYLFFVKKELNALRNM